MMTSPTRKILIIDHARTHRLTYQAYLQSDSVYHYDFLEATSAAEGLAVCRDLEQQNQSQLLDGILLEYELPDLDGISFLTQLKAQMGQASPLAVMINGSNPRIAVQAIKNGVEDYLIRDQFTPDELRVAVQSAIANTHLRRQLQAAEQALQKSEARYRKIVEDQTELICRFLPDTTLTFVNSAYSRYFGRSIEDLIGQPFLILIPENAQAEAQQQVAELVARTPVDPVVVHEHEVLKPNGEIGWQQWINRAIFDENGQLLELQAVGRDITERKQTELQLQENQIQAQQILDRLALVQKDLQDSEERFQLTFECVTVGIAHVSLDRSWLRLNQKFCDILGYTAAELRERTVQDITYPSDLDPIRQVLAHELQTLSLETRLISKNGSIVWVALTVSLVRETKIESNLPGAPKFFIFVVEEISDRKVLEAEPRRVLASSQTNYQGDTAETGFLLSEYEILVVDDVADDRELLKFALQAEGATVEVASSVAEALEKLQQFKPNLLLCDLGMPVEDGYALLRQVRQLSPEQGGQVPAIAITAYVTLDDRRRALAAGFQNHLAKPIDFATLVTLILEFPRRL
jgi:PAS domain S-box-containing protein